tara:strand:- start:25698 stop:26819 length:1122 start_codon:yes stop_codon:yes gene_type:complete
MAKTTKIQWCDSTVNPVMGCDGCELYSAPGVLLAAMDRTLLDAGCPGWQQGMSREVTRQALATAWAKVDQPKAGHVNDITTTNIRHLRHMIGERVASQFGKSAGKTIVHAIERHLTCYAAQLHANRGRSIVNPGRQVNRGYAPTFEQVTQMPGRVAETAKSCDLTGTARPEKPWLDGLPRLIFVSDMGDALSQGIDFEFLLDEIIQTAESEKGRRHRWLWLTKRPGRMAKFSDWLLSHGHEWPANLWAGTSVTSPESYGRAKDLLSVGNDRTTRFLSVEPQFASVDLTPNIGQYDWVIQGGESGGQANARPFHLEWAKRLLDVCAEAGVPYFLKQLGSNVLCGGQRMKLSDGHGGDWAEWPASLRVRQMPDCG